jgi:hypothetical protein
MSEQLILYTNTNINKHCFQLLSMYFDRLIIIVELFLYLYRINDIHKCRFEDFLIGKKKYIWKLEKYEGIHTTFETTF